MPPQDPTKVDTSRLYTPEEADRLVPRLEEAFATVERHRGTLRALILELERDGVDLNQRLERRTVR